jgi:hypothetical protein
MEKQQQERISPQDLKPFSDKNVYYMSDYQRKYIGSKIDDFPVIKEFFSKNTVDFISKECTKQLKGVDEQGRDIVIPDKRILEVMNTVQLSYNFATGFGAPVLTPQIYFTHMVDETIERIVYDVSNTLAIEQCNMKKTIWTTVLGDFNKQKLQSHSQIKIRNKHPNFNINMRY